MSRRITVLVAAAAALGLTALAIGTAPAAQRPPGKVRMSILGRAVFDPGKSLTITQRFSPRDFAIRSGGRVVLRNRDRLREEHTISLVRRSQLPDSFNCRVCQQIGRAHEVNEQTGEVGRPVVNVGKPGFNRPGDSRVIRPRQTIRFRVTAARGKNLYFLCAIHPWMQGRIRVG